MSTSCLRYSLRHYGGPVLFLVAVCFVIGILLLGLASELSAVFMLAGLGALVVFGLMGAREERGRYLS
jgi:hypothetical protein